VKITVLSPHRMDVALSLGLVVGSWLEQGHAVEVVNCFTRSGHAPFSDADSVHENDRMSFVSALRKREDEAWHKLYRSAKLTFTDLNLKDAPLRLHCTPEEVFTVDVNPNDKAFAKIHKALERSRAAAMVFPLGLDGHVDRRIAFEAALPFAGTSPVAFYEDQPFAAQGLVSIEDAVQGMAARLGAELTPVFASAETDAEAAVARKRRLVLCYVSQLDDAQVALVAGDVAQHGGRERLWANAKWRELFAA
jgi:LmbE family N-acetylglucosaminyl deacetylase